jgi:hypothetical protein
MVLTLEAGVGCAAWEVGVGARTRYDLAINDHRHRVKRAVVLPLH